MNHAEWFSDRFAVLTITLHTHVVLRHIFGPLLAACARTSLATAFGLQICILPTHRQHALICDIQLTHPTLCLLLIQAMVVVPSELMYLAAPGTGIPIQAAVNGAPASMTCGSATANLPTAAAAGTVDANELSSITTPAGTCVYVYSSWVTPVITSFSSLTVGDTSSGSVNLTLSGTRLTDVTSDYSVTVGGVTCPVIEADAGVSGVNGSVTCTLPSMSAGAQELRVMVAGRGSAQLPNGKVRDRRL